MQALFRLTLKFITDQSTSDYGYNDTITNEIDFDKLLNETIAKQSLNTPSTSTARDVAAAPQTPQLGEAQANFGGPS